MQGCVTEITSLSTSVASKEKNRRFISAYWLRPENAFWMALRSEALSAVPLEGPILDLSCGDGVFSFLHAGGKFAPQFDVFKQVKDLDSANGENEDIFDFADATYSPEIAGAPQFRIACGTDHKASMLTKASKLDLYDRLVEHDNNEPLPFENGSFQTVYCNSVYWVERIDVMLSEIRRVTAAGGTVVLHVKLDSIRDYTLERHRDQLGDRWLDLIDRGRFATWPSLADGSEWDRRFEEAGLEVLRADPFVTGTHAHVWDIGLRPIAPLLIKTMNSIHPHLRTEIKRDWVDLFCRLLEPFCNPELDLFAEASEPVEIQYILTPRQ